MLLQQQGGATNVQLPQVGSCDHVILCELLTPSVTCGHTYVKDFTNTVLLFEVVMLRSHWVGRKSHRACCLCSNMWEITHNSIGNSGVLSTAFRINGYRHLPCSVIAWQHLDRSTVQRKNSQGNRGNTGNFMSVFSWIKSTHTITFCKTSSPNCNLLALPTLCAGDSTLNLF